MAVSKPGIVDEFSPELPADNNDRQAEQIEGDNTGVENENQVCKYAIHSDALIVSSFSGYLVFR